jgi:SAM-dependent methyltransferase
MALYCFEKKGKSRILAWKWSRTRGLKEAKDRIGDITKEVEILLKNKKKIKILEVGCGYGRAIIELKKLFGEKVETFGINAEPPWNLKLIKKYALNQKLGSKGEVENLLPRLYILDAGKKMPFKNDYFDLIFSQATIQYIEDKAFFLQEAHRILAKCGLFVCDIQDEERKYPPEYQHRWEIWNGEKKILISNILKNYENIRIAKAKFRQDGYVIMKKSKNFKLSLKLVYSFDLNKINDKWAGRKSIYILKKVAL